MGTADAPTSKRLHLRGVDKHTLPKVVRAIASSQPWRAACMEYARCTEYGERTHASLSPTDLAPVLRLILKAVESNVTFGGGASIQDLAKLGCPGALLSVVEMQVKKVSKRTHEESGETPAVRLGRRPTTNPRNTTRRSTSTGPGRQDVIATGPSPSPTTMSVFSIRRLRLLNHTDTHLKFRLDGISGGEDSRVIFKYAIERDMTEQVRELELLEKRTFVPEGRLKMLIERELAAVQAS